MTEMRTYFNIKPDVAQCRIDDFLSNFDCRRTFPYKGFK